MEWKTEFSECTFSIHRRVVKQTRRFRNKNRRSLYFSRCVSHSTTCRRCIYQKFIHEQIHADLVDQREIERMTVNHIKYINCPARRITVYEPFLVCPRIRWVYVALQTRRLPYPSHLLLLDTRKYRLKTRETERTVGERTRHTVCDGKMKIFASSGINPLGHLARCTIHFHFYACRDKRASEGNAKAREAATGERLR